MPGTPILSLNLVRFFRARDARGPACHVNAYRVPAYRKPNRRERRKKYFRPIAGLAPKAPLSGYAPGSSLYRHWIRLNANIASSVSTTHRPEAIYGHRGVAPRRLLSPVLTRQRNDPFVAQGSQDQGNCRSVGNDA